MRRVAARSSLHGCPRRPRAGVVLCGVDHRQVHDLAPAAGRARENAEQEVSSSGLVTTVVIGILSRPASSPTRRSAASLTAEIRPSRVTTRNAAPESGSALRGVESITPMPQRPQTRSKPYGAEWLSALSGGGGAVGADANVLGFAARWRGH